MQEITVKSSVRNYTVKFVNSFAFIENFLLIPNYVVVVGNVVYKIYKNQLFNQFSKKNLIVLRLGEERKTLDTAIKLYEKLLIKAAKKNIVLISFGGGINQDICGFVASTLYRGIRWIYVPTTLLAQADSAIGSKTGLNFKSYKNVVGTFYPPSEIYIYVDFLKTLEKKDYFSGVGEIIKFCLMKKNALQDLEKSRKDIQSLVQFSNKKQVEDVIKKSIEIKLHYIKGDEFDRGKRNLLNYGHEFGHALESTSSFTIPHGVSVIIGIIFANLVAKKRGFLHKNIFEVINNRLLLPYIPNDVVRLKPEYFRHDKLLEKIKKDKKRVTERLPLILPKENFQLTKITDLGFEEFKKALFDLINILQPFLR